ncbi:MAG: hypothetical protein U0353_33675 [Sandaracinus sp.]
MAHARVLVVCTSLLLVLSSAGACSSFDATRRPAPRGTLGEEIVRVFCERMAREAHPEDVSGEAWKPVCRAEVPPPDGAPPRLVTLMENRDRLAGALDQVLPEDLHDELSTFLYRLLPLYDPPVERLPRNTRLVADLLASIADDEDAIAALARVGTRTGYRPLRLGLGVVRPALAYPELDGLSEQALGAIGEGGSAHAQWQAVEAALAMEMATYEPAEPPVGDRTTLALSRDLLFSSHEDIASGTPRFVLRRDERGIAMVNGGTVTAPFVDEDGDGLPDVDSLGRFVDTSGEVLGVARPFRVRDEGAIPRDASGRALDPSTGQRLYEYLDVDGTMLAGLVREAEPWFSGPTPVILDLTRGLPAMLGPSAMQSRTYGGATLRYQGYDTAQGPAFDTLYALAQTMRRPETADTLEAVRRLLDEHESEAAGVVHSAHFLISHGDDYPDAALEQPNVLWDDLTNLADGYTQQGELMEAILRSFTDDRSRRLGPVYAGLMRYRDSIDYDRSDVNAPPTGFPLDQRVDRAMPDVEGNESLMERSIALIDGLDGVRVCNKAGARLRIQLLGLNVAWPLFGSYDECELIEIDNVAEAYALAILGRYELELHDSTLSGLLDLVEGIGILNVDDLLEQASGIHGLTRHPTPQALNRMVFWGLDLRGEADCRDEDNVFLACLFDRVHDRHGRDVIDNYSGTIFAWEQPGFYEGMAPLLEVLHDPRYSRDSLGRYQFGHLITTLYRHWPTHMHWRSQRTDPAASTFSHQENARSYEELVAEGFDTGPEYGNLIENLVDATQLLDDMDMGGGRDGIDALADFVPALLSPAANPGLTTRSGETTIPWNDGSRTTGVTPLQLVLLALRNADATWASGEGATRVEAWRRGRDAIARQLLDTRTLGEGYQFVNRRGRAIVLLLLPFVLERLEHHRSAGDLDSWASDFTPDAEETLGGPLPVGLVRLLDQIQSEPEARDALVAFLAYLVSETSDNDAQLATLYGAADLLQTLDDEGNITPILHALSVALAPNARTLAAGGAGEPETTASVANDALDLVQTVQGLDTDRVLVRILQNMVVLDADENTPLETILDVMSEVNRSAPGVGGPYEPDDFVHALGISHDFMTDETHGLERLYDVVQNRCVDMSCPPEVGP